MRQRNTFLLGVSVLALTAIAPNASAVDYCWDQAAREQNIAPELLMAISKVESGFNPYAMNVNRTTVDHGHMQINSLWLRDLQRVGIERKQLFDPCTCTRVGAWILAHNIAKYGYTWEAIGAYHAGEKNPVARREYAWKVYRVLLGMGSNQRIQMAIK